MGHDDEIVRPFISPQYSFRTCVYCCRDLTDRIAQTVSLLERAWKSGFDVCMLTVDTWQLGWRPTDITIANYTYARAPLLASALDGSRSFSLSR